MSEKLKVIETFKGNSKYDFWKKLSVGDIIQFSTVLKRTGFGSRGIYVTTYIIYNLSNNTHFEDTINNFMNYINKIKFI